MELANGGELSPGLIILVLGFKFGHTVLKVADVLDRRLDEQCQSRSPGDGYLGIKTGPHTCKMANLCISPVQAGIILLSRANSSFILLRLLLSIRLCAVFLAIFLPAVLDALGGFFLPCCCDTGAEASPAVAFALAPAPLPLLPVSLPFDAVVAPDVSAGPSCGGFIWMILRERVGGGGRAKLLSFAWPAAEARRRALTTSAAWRGYDDDGDVGDCLGVSVGEMRPASWRAGGGSSNATDREASFWVPSCPQMSPEEPGVGGKPGRGMV
jgi:hypothetical protein